METTQFPKAEAGLPNLIRKVLGSQHAEQVIKLQMVNLASQNLHVPEVTTALLEVLPQVKDKETKDQLLYLLTNLNTSRFSDLESLYGTLLQVFRQEKDRSVKTTLLQRLQQGLHQDQRLLTFFIDLMQEELLSEPERQQVLDALGSVPSVSQEIAMLALQRCTNASYYMQEQAVILAERCPVWGDTMANVLSSYLNIKNENNLRLRILRKLAEAKRLTPFYSTPLIQILQTDTDPEVRIKALQCLASIKPCTSEIIAQLMWSAQNDGDEVIRVKATNFQKEVSDLSNEQLIAMAQSMATDRSAGVRISILEMLKPVMRIKEIREAVATSFANNPAVFEDEEFTLLIDMLAPYAGRDHIIGASLLKSLEGLPNLLQRQKVLQLVIPKVKIETVLDTVVHLFSRERNETLRGILFNQIKGLSVARHPELVDVFCNELMEPSSVFRHHSAGILSVAAELYEQIPSALEDVLLHDQDRELIRVCLEGYLRPRVQKRFEVLSEVLRNEVIDTNSRQQCLNEIMKLNLNPEQQEQLTLILSGLKPNTLKM